MAYCGPRGIPYTVWLREADGWDDLSRAAAIAWQRREAGRCSGCGLVRADLRDENGQELRRLPVRAELEHCPGCRIAHGARDKDTPGWHHTRFVPVGSASPEVG